MIGLTKGHSSSSTLVVTFLLGIGIGIALCYAVADTFKMNFGDPLLQVTAQPPVAPAAGAPAETAELPPAPQDTPPAEVALAEPAVDAEVAPPADSSTAYWPGIHLALTVSGTELSPEEAAILGEVRPGMVLLEAQNVFDDEQTRSLVLAIKEAAGMGTSLSDFPLIAIAQEGGPLFNPLHLEDAPSPAMLAAETERSKVSETAGRYAQAALNRQVAVLIGPSLDVYQPGVSDPLLESQTFSTDPEVVAQVGINFAENLSDSGVIPVVKHFPGLGGAVPGMQAFPTLEFENHGAMAKLIFPFYEAAARKMPGMLIGQVAVPIMNQDRPHLSAVFSDKLIGDLIRRDWEYEGVLIADNMYEALQAQTLAIEIAVVNALLVGCDVVVLKNWSADDIRRVIAAVEVAPDLSSESRNATYDRLAGWQDRLKATLAKPTAPPEGMRLVAHVVEPGESLVSIAQAYNVDTAALMQWNGLSTTEVRDGRRITLYLPNESASPALVDLPAENPAAEIEAPAEVVPVAETEADTDDEKPEAEAPETEAPTGTTETPTAPAPPEEVETPEADTEAAAPVEVPAPAEAQPEEETPVEAEAMPEADSEATAPPEETATPAPAPEEVPEEEAPTEEPAPEVAPEAEKAAPKVETPPAPVVPDASIATTKREHTVVTGDTLSRIANQYGVSQADLKAWNGRESDTVKIGETLLVYLPVAEDVPDAPEGNVEDSPEVGGEEDPEVAPTEEAAEEDTDEAVVDPAPEDGEEQPEEAAAAPAPEKPAVEYELYTVSAGDNLGRIASKFGVSRQDLMDLNNITNPNHVQLGQRLKIPKK